MGVSRVTTQAPAAWGTKATLGGRLWPLNAAESAIALTAANIDQTVSDQISFNVLRYKARGDGVTDDTAAFQNAMNAAAKVGGRVMIPHLPAAVQTQYLINSVLNIPAGITIEASDGVVIVSGITNANQQVFNATSTLGATNALTADAFRGNQTISVTNSVAVGTLIRIRTNQFKFATSGRNQELNVVIGVTGVGPFTLTLRHRLIRDYAVANTAEILPATTPITNVVIKNVHIQIPTGKDGGGFYFESAYDIRLVDCDVQGSNGQPAYQCWRAAYVHALRCNARDGQNMATPGLGYGVNMAESSHNCTFESCTFSNVRENAVASNAKHCHFIDCTATNGFDNGFNSHGEGSEDCDFVGCKSLYSKSKGFVVANTSAQDQRIRFINCQSFYSGYTGFFLIGSAGVQHADVQVINCDVRDSGNNTALSRAVDAENMLRLKIRGLRVSDLNGNNDRGMLFVSCVDTLLDDIDLQSITNTFPIGHDTCTNLELRNSRFAAFGANEFCHSQGTASTGVWIHHCRTDQDVIPTLNTGDRLDSIQFPTIKLRAAGVNSVANAAVITHGMGVAPDGVIAISQVAVRTVAVRNITSTQFEVDINVANTGTADAVAQNIMWWAWKGPVTE